MNYSVGVVFLIVGAVSFGVANGSPGESSSNGQASDSSQNGSPLSGIRTALDNYLTKAQESKQKLSNQIDSMFKLYPELLSLMN